MASTGAGCPQRSDCRDVDRARITPLFAGNLAEYAQKIEFGLRVYPTIAGTLGCGGKKIAMDAVLIIAEHGDDPVNDIGQKLYPRYEFFQQCVKVFEQDKRAAPAGNA